MPVLVVGATSIPYEIKRSQRASRQRIIVTSGKVEVIAPEAKTDDEVAEFVYAKRRWVFDETEKMREKAIAGQGPCHFVTGAKILYRGRNVRLNVSCMAIDEIVIEYRNGFHIAVPYGLNHSDHDGRVELALTAWLKQRMSQDVAALIRLYGKELSVTPKGYRIKEQKYLWGSCGKDGIINLNWQLVFAPKPVLEYVVVHELCHLRYRNHTDEFWGLVGSELPDYSIGKNWLDNNEGMLRLRQG